MTTSLLPHPRTEHHHRHHRRQRFNLALLRDSHRRLTRPVAEASLRVVGFAAEVFDSVVPPLSSFPFLGRYSSAFPTTGSGGCEIVAGSLPNPRLRRPSETGPRNHTPRKARRKRFSKAILHAKVCERFVKSRSGWGQSLNSIGPRKIPQFLPWLQ